MLLSNVFCITLALEMWYEYHWWYMTSLLCYVEKSQNRKTETLD